MRGFATRAVHTPKLEPQDGTPIAPLLDLSSTYAFDDPERFAEASVAKVGSGYVYARWANPTVDAFKAAVADLEGGDEGEGFSSGMAAISAVFLALCSQGDKIAAVRQLYGNTYSLLSTRLPRYGIETTFFDHDDLEAARAASQGARLLYCETIGNPRVQVNDVPALAAIAAEAGIPLVVDNTFASPVLCRPIEHGASIVIHSATKYLGGHHDLLGGVIVCGAPEMDKIRAVSRDLGPTMAPLSAWLGIRGIATLELRVLRSSATALAVAESLQAHSDVEAVYYPALESDPSKSLADKLLGGRGGGTMGFEVSGGRERTARFQEALRLVTPAASLGGSHSLLVHAASVTHTQLTAAELGAAGIAEGFCRLSIGLEDPNDLIEDLHQALEASREMT
ncbi:MAG: aminotransferase class I/II-fold pyridoxal phosphate-dependent enzyme [Actinobacteria bacterium]|nr:aminotransferase class I/II-fold pyridoxal phosphate-dependent enzyme [Actinomycetota bacterium]